MVGHESIDINQDRNPKEEVVITLTKGMSASTMRSLENENEEESHFHLVFLIIYF